MSISLSVCDFCKNMMNYENKPLIKACDDCESMFCPHCYHFDKKYNAMWCKCWCDCAKCESRTMKRQMKRIRVNKWLCKYCSDELSVTCVPEEVEQYKVILDSDTN